MAVGGVFGIMNTMFAAISQRTKDIGVLRILGFAPWQVLLSFFFEAVLLATIGGLLGCAVGMLSDGWTASSIMSSGQAEAARASFCGSPSTRGSWGRGWCSPLVLGCLGGLIPALSAMRLKPLDAVR